MAPFGPPGFGAQWSKESVDLARERGEQQLAEADRRRALHDTRREGGGPLARWWHRLSGRRSGSDSPPDTRRAGR